MYYIYFIILNILILFSNFTLTVTTNSFPLKSLKKNKPLITQILVFSPSLETVIAFEPKSGWILGEERKLRLYISGSNLENNSIVFSSSPNECKSNTFVSPTYSLSSASIVEVNIKLKGISKSHSSIYLCLLPTLKLKINESQSENETVVEGTYFIFLREKGTLPFAAKVCLILMLFMVSGFFR